MELRGKIAIVTGGGTGIGRAVCLRLAGAGAKAVVINYSRSADEAEATAAEVSSSGSQALAHRANIADEAMVKVMIATTVDRFGGLDVLVNNAGTTHFVAHPDLDGLTEEVWSDILSVNLKGTFYCCRAALPALQERGGNIVNVTSVAGQSGLGSSIPYAASKAAVNCLTKSLARAFGPRVRVNAVAPGPVLTRWLADHMERVQQSLQGTPLGRAAEPEDIADAICYLALGTTLTTGQVLVVDGGRTV